MAQGQSLEPLSDELGIHVCGGRGKHSRQTPQELVAIGDRVGFDGAQLAQASRLVAKVDSAAVQDGFDLYLHGFVVTDDGSWIVVQQGMNGSRRQARRYQWPSQGLTSFLEDPHAAIDGVAQGNIVNLADRRADASRNAQLDLLSSLGPDKIAREFRDEEEEFEGMLDAAYEGRRGASAREILTLLNDAALDEQFRCLSPLAMYEEPARLDGSDPALWERHTVEV